MVKVNRCWPCLSLALALLLSACLAPPAPEPTPTATSQPPTRTPPPSATAAPIPTATTFAPPINLAAIRTVPAASAPASYDPQARVISGLRPLQALALDEAAFKLFVIAPAQLSAGDLQLYQLDLETGVFISGPLLSGFDSLDDMLALPATGEEAGVLLSGCRERCGIWRVQLLGDEILQLVDSPEALRALHFIRDPLGHPLGISFLEPATEAGANGVLISHDFLETPVPTTFEAASTVLFPADVGAPADMLAIAMVEMSRIFFVLEDGGISYGDTFPETDEPFTVIELDSPGEALQPPIRFVEGSLELFPTIDRRIILRFDRLEDSCDAYRQALGEEVAIVATDGEISLTRIALSRVSTGPFEHATGVFQTLDVPGQEFSESYSGRVDLDGTISGLYMFERENCPVTYAISGRLDPGLPVIAPPLLTLLDSGDGTPALGLLAADQGDFIPWLTFSESLPGLIEQSPLSASGELTLTFGADGGVQVVRLRTP